MARSKVSRSTCPSLCMSFASTASSSSLLGSTLASAPGAPAEIRKELEQPTAKTETRTAEIRKELEQPRAKAETRKELAQDALNFLGKAQKEAVQSITGAPAGNEWELL